MLNSNIHFSTLPALGNSFLLLQSSPFQSFHSSTCAPTHHLHRLAQTTWSTTPTTSPKFHTLFPPSVFPLPLPCLFNTIYGKSMPSFTSLFLHLGPWVLLEKTTGPCRSRSPNTHALHPQMGLFQWALTALIPYTLPYSVMSSRSVPSPSWNWTPYSRIISYFIMKKKTIRQ